VSRIVALAALVVLGACHSAPPPTPVMPAQANEESPDVIHARAAAILSCGVCPPISAGDTFVTWTPKPDLYTTVSRTDSTVASSLVSTDGVIGTAQAVWQGGRQREVRIRWTRTSATLMELNVRLEAGVIHLAGARDTAFRAPSLPWAVADYGMEDQLLPLIRGAGVHARHLRVAIYRPRQERWDTVSITCRRTQGATLATVTEPDGEHFFWTITADGALVWITRDRNRGFQRRPLELNNRVADYVRLRKLWEH
jgi:hypothetical protein